MKSSGDIHPTLARQLRRLGIKDAAQPPSEAAWRGLLEVVTRAYASGEEDRYLLERSLDISSREMEELYESLRRSSETRVAAERDRLSSIVEALDDGLCVLDREGLIEGLNSAAIRLLGGTREALLGQFWQYEGVDGVAIISSTGKVMAEDMRNNSTAVTLAGFFMRGAAQKWKSIVEANAAKAKARSGQ